MEGAPKWLQARRVEKVTDRVESYLEWDIRRVRVLWYTDAQAFAKGHGYGDTVLAFARKQDNSIHIGPRVTDANFDGVFGHELTHIILFQKYQGSVPNWLEEGLSNFVSKQGKVDYAWLGSQPPRDVTSLSHPFKSLTVAGAQPAGFDAPRYHYQASTALIEMIAAKCDLRDLLQLSLKKKLETYLANTCGLSDVNQEFRKWLARKARAAPKAP